jgi:hypothetical protein
VTNTENQNSRNIAAALITSLVLGAWIYGTFFNKAGDESSSDCYERVGQEMSKREGNKAVNSSDVERYHREMTSRCS